MYMVTLHVTVTPSLPTKAWIAYSNNLDHIQGVHSVMSCNFFVLSYCNIWILSSLFFSFFFLFPFYYPLRA
jgi:hypothetical protein